MHPSLKPSSIYIELYTITLILLTDYPGYPYSSTVYQQHCTFVASSQLEDNVG